MFFIWAQAPHQWNYSMPQVLWDSSTWVSVTDWSDCHHKKEISTLQTSIAYKTGLSWTQLDCAAHPDALDSVTIPVKSQYLSGLRYGYVPSFYMPQFSVDIWDHGQEENSGEIHWVSQPIVCREPSSSLAANRKFSTTCTTKCWRPPAK